MRAPNKHQRKMHSRTLGTSIGGGCGRASIPAAHDKAQAGTHVRPGSICRSAPPSGLTQFLPVRTGGGFGSRLFSHSRIARRSLRFEHRRVVCSPNGQPATFHVVHDGRIGELCYAARLPAKFSRRLTESRAHQLRITRKPGSDRADPFHSYDPSSGVTFHAQEHEPKGVGSAQEVIGVYQHDHC